MDVPINDLKVWQTPKVEQLRPTQISMFAPSADEAMAELVQLFSDPSLASKAQFRCCVDGPTEFEVLFESIGYNPNSEYKRWVRSLYRLGLILRIPSEWEAPERPEGKSS
jgi:hypothetical protein